MKGTIIDIVKGGKMAFKGNSFVFSVFFCMVLQYIIQSVKASTQKLESHSRVALIHLIGHFTSELLRGFFIKDFQLLKNTLKRKEFGWVKIKE